MKKWKIGFAVAMLFGLLSAGAGLAAGMKWQAFVAVLCTSLATHLGAYLMKHPVDEVQDTNPAAFTRSNNSTTQFGAPLIPPED